MLTHKTIERLSKMGQKEFYMTSFYLNIDKGHHHDFKIVTKDLLKDRRHKLEQYRAAKKITRAQAQSIEKDFEKIEHFVQHELIHADPHKGLVIFSCTAAQFWEKMELPQAVASYLNADYDPFVRPLSELICAHRSYAVLLIDSAKARILNVTLGLVKEHLHIEDPVQPKIKYGGIEGTQERNIGRAHDEMVHKHYKHVAAEAEKLFDHKDLTWLIIGGKQKIISQFESLLSGNIRKKVIGHMVVEPEAPLHDILRKSEEVAKRAEEKYETDLINRLKGEAHTSGGKGTFGLQPTLQSLRKGGVNTLVVAKGFTAPGFVCHKCFFIGTPEEKGARDTCPICAGAAHNVDDVVEEAITFAFMQGCRVENTRENSRLKIMGNVGALLRY